MSKQDCSSLDFFREAAPYIYNHRGKTFVIALGGEVIESPDFMQTLKDIAILSTLGVRIILVHGARPQVARRLQEIDHGMVIKHDMRVTDEVTLDIVVEIAGKIRTSIENMLTHILNTPPVINDGIGVLSGNLITAKPLGIHNGIDYKHTGVVRKINTDLLKTLLDSDNIVLLPPLGYSPTGKIFNVRFEQIASFTARAIKAEKLIFLHTSDMKLPRQTGRKELADLIATEPAQENFFADLGQALDDGVERIHLIDARMQGALLLELYTRDGIGALFSADNYENTRFATIDDVGGILELIHPLEEKGFLIKRSREQLELEAGNFVVTERDQKIISCAACYPIPDTGMAELACLAVDQQYRGKHRGDALLDFIERYAQQQGTRQLLVLTTQTTDWFRERGFIEGAVEDLPEAKKSLYNYKRNSKILLKDLARPPPDNHP